MAAPAVGMSADIRADQIGPVDPLSALAPAEREAVLAMRQAGLRPGKPRTLVLFWNGTRLVALDTVQIR